MLEREYVRGYVGVGVCMCIWQGGREKGSEEGEVRRERDKSEGEEKGKVW